MNISLSSFLTLDINSSPSIVTNLVKFRRQKRENNKIYTTALYRDKYKKPLPIKFSYEFVELKSKFSQMKDIYLP